MLEKKVAFITGGSKRLGRILSETLADMGYQLAVHYNTSYEKGLPEDTYYVKGDFTDPEQAQTCFKKVIDHCGHIDLLINSSAIFESSPLADANVTHTLNHININLTVPIILSQLFEKHCKYGQIINITDAKHSYVNKVVYETSKAALTTFTEKSALECAPNIRINAIAPGWILNPDDASKSHIQALESLVPLQRQAKKEELQTTLKFLIENDYITGQTIYVDGGLHCK
jgi:pteridine reductase